MGTLNGVIQLVARFARVYYLYIMTTVPPKLLFGSSYKCLGNRIQFKIQELAGVRDAKAFHPNRGSGKRVAYNILKTITERYSKLLEKKAGSASMTASSTPFVSEKSGVLTKTMTQTFIFSLEEASDAKVAAENKESFCLKDVGRVIYFLRRHENPYLQAQPRTTAEIWAIHAGKAQASSSRGFVEWSTKGDVWDFLEDVKVL